MISLGVLLNIPTEAQALVRGLRKRLELLEVRVREIAPGSRMTVARVLDFNNENMIVAGPRSFQYDVIRHGGGMNVTTDLDEAYPKVAFQQLRSWDPEMIFLCGGDGNTLPRLKADCEMARYGRLKTDRIYQFDCGLTCRTGPRIVDMAELLFQTLYA